MTRYVKRGDYQGQTNLRRTLRHGDKMLAEHAKTKQQEQNQLMIELL